MRFRPCIDIHHGAVKQIVGGSLSDTAGAQENFVSDRTGAYYAGLYKSRGLSGGHIIMLDPAGSDHHEADRKQAFTALEAFPGGMQIGGGVNADNAYGYIEKGASHVIVTSYVFKDGEISFERLDKLVSAVGSEHIVLDLSCRKRDGEYFIVTDRWQKFTDVRVTAENIMMLKKYCDEFLVHAVDVEGKQHGIEADVVRTLGGISGIKATYAGGIGSLDDIAQLKALGSGNVDFTVGSALDIFGGKLKFDDVCAAADK